MSISLHGSITNYHGRSNHIRQISTADWTILSEEWIYEFEYNRHLYTKLLITPNMKVHEVFYILTLNIKKEYWL